MTKSFSDLTESAKVLVLRLQRGQTTLTDQHRRWFVDDPKAAKDAVFSDALGRWDALEQVFRCAQPSGCIWGPGKSCPEDAPVICHACLRQS